MSGTAQYSTERAQPLILVVRAGAASDTEPILSAAGFEVSSSADGLRAFEQIGNRAPDLIILDLGADGVEACRRLKENMAAREIPMIFLTSENDRKQVPTALHCGAADYIVRP